MLDTNRRYPWEEFYAAAVLETDSSLLPARIRTAQAAMNSRIEHLKKDHEGTPEERKAIASALAWIRLLEKERL